jgi:Flp pilus assembly pilin Flp
MWNLLRNLHRDDGGQDMIEYGLLAAFISIAAIVAIKAIEPLVRTLYENVESAVT